MREQFSPNPNYRIPVTNYLKFFDLWQFISLAIPFAEVLLHIVIDNLKSKESNRVRAIRKVKPIVCHSEKEVPQIEVEQADNEIDLDGNEIPMNTARKLAFVKNFATYGISILYALFISISLTIFLVVD